MSFKERINYLLQKYQEEEPGLSHSNLAATFRQNYLDQYC